MKTQKGKFNNLTVDKGTEILLRQQTIFNGYDIMMESWIWDEIQGQSVIFHRIDIEHLTDDELINMIKEHYNTEAITISRSNAEYVFLNFNFTETK